MARRSHGHTSSFQGLMLSVTAFALNAPNDVVLQMVIFETVERKAASPMGALFEAVRLVAVSRTLISSKPYALSL